MEQLMLVVIELPHINLSRDAATLALDKRGALSDFFLLSLSDQRNPAEARFVGRSTRKTK
jgi:hypothetical protein